MRLSLGFRISGVCDANTCYYFIFPFFSSLLQVADVDDVWGQALAVIDQCFAANGEQGREIVHVGHELGEEI